MIREITEQAWSACALRLAVDEAALRAVAEVESSGSGFLPPPSQQPKVRFEGHVFHRLTGGRFDTTAPRLSYARWDRSKYAGSSLGEWQRLEAAVALDRDAALKSASWGAFQLMGFNHAMCGFPDVERFVQAHMAGGDAQLAAFASFVDRAVFLDPLRRHDWASFARAYNGPGYAANQYDRKLAHSYARHHVPGSGTKGTIV
ncbi:N-acetylmuramidase family protein [Lysobacter sp. LF1]|uniref:N-acetylmuramidase family protein n=1 Tax=Lysobacter stagni TaxID=3045172 RepID=A0ABT6XID0_9GAMM|nr:N-acetylmuramidase family protein [Lysobacter sp. LF1]MDI9239905.1 N-acetylmuramidase family protein [Lysobacter sp. LF1]